MGLFDIFRKRNDGQKATPPAKPSLPLLCYDIAYTAVPHVAFNDCDGLVKMFREGPISVGTFLYVRVCQAVKTEIVREDAKRFREHFGEL